MYLCLGIWLEEYGFDGLHAGRGARRLYSATESRVGMFSADERLQREGS